MSDSIEAAAKPSKYKAYCFTERSSSLAGPFPLDVTALAIKDNSSEVYCISEEKEILKSDLLDLNDPVFQKVSDPIDTTANFDPYTQTGIVADKDGSFLYRGKYLPSPFTDAIVGKGTISDPLWFKDCYLSIAETNWMHFGSESAEKEVYRIDLSFHTNSIGHAWLYIQNDSGKVSGQYKGPIKEIVKVFTNLRGRRFKLKLFVATHENYPWAMREMAVGYNIGKSF
jgi:hypothetical protein